MADDKVRLWRVYGYRPFQDEWVFEEPAHTGPEDACEYIARPRADDDAREADRAVLETLLECHKVATNEWKARAEKAEAECAQLRARLDAATGGAS